MAKTVQKCQKWSNRLHLILSRRIFIHRHSPPHNYCHDIELNPSVHYQISTGLFGHTRGIPKKIRILCPIPDLKSVCLQNWSKWLNLWIKGESFVCFINGDPCGYSALFLFSVHTTPREFSQFEITKNAQNISLRPQPWTWGGDSFWQGWKICSWRV